MATTLEAVRPIELIASAVLLRVLSLKIAQRINAGNVDPRSFEVPTGTTEIFGGASEFFRPSGT
jgi:hypothetical protein